MKFKSIKLKNFMRYKGTNEITFSCDGVRNVTVILGDNTVGKTTIAQAFRWGLYGAILSERGKKENDYQLLNNDILALMDANGRAGTSVEILAEDDEKRYRIRREIEYTRDYPKMTAREFQKKLNMWISDAGSREDEIEIETVRIDEVINELFPKTLSHYFLFDGERWNDVTVNGVRENIKDSVHILTGLSAYRAAMWHLKEMGTNSVIRRLKGKISGGGNIYDSLERERNQLEREIEKFKIQIETIEVNINNAGKKCREIEQYLEEKKSTEEMQGKYRHLLVNRRTQDENRLLHYRALVNEFSDKAYMAFAQNMIQTSLELVKSISAERRDIPHMRQASIDYIIKTGTCICGTQIRPDTKEFSCLMEQRNYLPPADIGSLLGEFERTGSRWKNRTNEFGREMGQMAVKVDGSVREYEETCNRIFALEQKMEEHVDFAEKRNQRRIYEDEMRKLSVSKGEFSERIESYRKRIAIIEQEMKNQELKNAENAKWRKRLDLAESLYEKMQHDFSGKERQIFQELNRQVQTNFEQMFNAKDKKIELTEQYEIQMLYKTEVGYREEKNLSEGEKIARNFAFIVTIMDYSRSKKAESDTLPIVLDGPFSKLGDENIRLIAQILPKVSEQVILFMLDKDWNYTGLDEYVGESYVIEKDSAQSYASIRRQEISLPGASTRRQEVSL